MARNMAVSVRQHLVVHLLAVSAVLIALAGCASLPAESPRDATYQVEGEPVRLQNGRAARPAAPGAATAIRTQMLGAPTYGDIDGDGDADAVLFLVQDSGGSGTFYYVAAAHKVDGGYRGGAAVLIGDRIILQRLDVIHGVVVVDYLERAPGEPMAAESALARTGYLTLERVTGHRIRCRFFRRLAGDARRPYRSQRRLPRQSDRPGSAGTRCGSRFAAQGSRTRPRDLVLRGRFSAGAAGRPRQPRRARGRDRTGRMDDDRVRSFLRRTAVSVAGAWPGAFDSE